MISKKLVAIYLTIIAMNALGHNIGNPQNPLRIAYQGEPGAYSEKASRELLGPRVMTVNYPSFEDVFKAVASRDADYAVIPIENSLGGSIHANCDLLLRYDLHIIAEHEFRVEHYLLTLPGVKREEIKKVMFHPQALAQCDNICGTWDTHPHRLMTQQDRQRSLRSRTCWTVQRSPPT